MRDGILPEERRVQQEQARVQEIEARVEEAEAELAKTVLRAPWDGYVSTGDMSGIRPRPPPGWPPWRRLVRRENWSGRGEDALAGVAPGAGRQPADK